jgi:dipeptidase E
MKLLLTSAGLTNTSIAKALFEMVGKKPEDTSLVFIPTASNIEKGDKDWLITDLLNLRNQHFKSIEIADISALPKDVWLPRLEEADVIFFEGGNTFYLMDWIRKSGLETVLPKLLETKVYVGVSAGSMVMCSDLSLKLSQILYEEDLDKTEDMPGLGYVDFYVLPHLNSAYFTKLREENIQKAVAGMIQKIYVLDDQSALKIVDKKVEIITEGKYLKFN